MTSWQDQQDRGGLGPTAVDPTQGQPLSRRAAREAERRAAEARAGLPPHPSGVVDFEPRGVGSDFAPDQDFSVGDTQDIWAALNRAGGPGSARDTGSFRRGALADPPRVDTPAVSDDLLDRVRDAVLRRGQEPGTPPARSAAETGPTRRDRRVREAADPVGEAPVAPFVDRRAAQGAIRPAAPVEPQQAFEPRRLAHPYGYDAPQAAAPLRQYAEPRYDEPQYAPPQPAPTVRAQPQGPGYDFEDDGYYDEPYAPEPTIAIRGLRSMELDAPSTTTNPISLPQSFAEPAGDDALTFSSPVPVQPADPYEDHRGAVPDPSFREPVDEWGYPRTGTGPSQRPALQPPTPFLEPQQPAYADPRLGPPSEVTDLAGFEALIRKARQQPTRPEQGPVLAWADDEEVQEGFTGLLSRSVQGSHGSTNALILPDPQPDLAQAVGATGDIFITGSMNLPRSLSTNGTTSAHDTHDMDRLFDAAQDEPAAGVAPVLAKRAISGDSRVIVNARRGRGNVLPTVLAIVAGAMAVGVVTLLAGSWFLHLF